MINMTWINDYRVWLTPTQSLQNAQKVVDYLYTPNRDWSKESISALIGNMRHESSVNPNMYEYGYDWSADRGFGLVQWTPRSKFWNWGVQRGYTESQLRSGDAQLARIDYEVNNNIQYIADGHRRRYGRESKYDFNFAAFRTNSPRLTVNQLTEAFMWNYEGPNYTAGLNSLNDRQAFARRAFNELDWSKGSKPDPKPDPNPDPDPYPDETDDSEWTGIDLANIISNLNKVIHDMLTHDLYHMGSSDYYKNNYLRLMEQMGNTFKIKPNKNFFDVIQKTFEDFNFGYVPEPDPNPDPDPNPNPDPNPPVTMTKRFPVRIQNGINFWKRSKWGVGTLQRNMGYGVRSNGANHFGYDIGGGGVKHNIYSITDGVVTHRRFQNGIGNNIVIANDDDVYHIQYGHLDSFRVNVGDRVKAGDLIAIMGDTGGNYAIHLDIKISPNGTNFYSWETTIDPEKYIEVIDDNRTNLRQP